VGIVLSFLALDPAYAKSLTPQQYIQRDGLDKGIRNYVTAKLRQRPYFMGKKPSDCIPVSPMPSDFEGVPVVDCVYKELNFEGWVRLAVADANLISDWILKAASLCHQPETCAAKIAEDAWLSNQYSFPIAGNIIEPAASAGGNGSAPLNLIFINGVTVSRPAFLAGHENIDTSVQRKCALALLATANAEVVTPVSGDTTGSCLRLGSAQVSRPAAIRQDIYVAYGDPTKTKAERFAEVGASCPASARKLAWLSISKSAFLTGVRTREHPLFDTAARAIDAGKIDLAKIDCKK
jgi:hypothetical protein